MGRRSGLARRGKGGGTIGGYAHKINKLLKFAFDLGTDLTDLNDGLFSDFIEDLRLEKAKDTPLNWQGTKILFTT